MSHQIGHITLSLLLFSAHIYTEILNYWRKIERSTNFSFSILNFPSKTKAIVWRDLYQDFRRISSTRFSANSRGSVDLIGGKSSGGSSTENQTLQLVFRNHGFCFAGNLSILKEEFSNLSIFRLC